VSWRVVDVKVIFLDVFAMIALAVGQAEQAFLQNGVALVPQSEREAELLFVLGDTSESVFAPVVGT